MLDSNDVSKHDFEKETQRFSGKVIIYNYGQFSEKYHDFLCNFEKQLPKSTCLTTKPITLQFEAEEDIALLQLVQSDNRLLSRILASLAAICNEIYILCLEAKDKYYSKYLYYGEVSDEETVPNFLNSFSSILKSLQELIFYVKRCRIVVALMLNQLAALSEKNLYVNNSTVYFPEPLDHLAELLVCLITLDALLTSASIQEHWLIYKRTIKSSFHSPSQFGVPLERLKFIDKVLIEIENELLNGNIFQKMFEHCLEDKGIANIKKSGLNNEFSLCIQNMLLELEKDHENISFTQILLQLNALFVFQHHIFGQIDKKQFKRILEVDKKNCACTLAGNILWYPEQFISKNIPALSKYFDEKLFSALRLNHLNFHSYNLHKEANYIILQGINWIISIENLVKLNLSILNLQQLQKQYKILVEGVKLMKQTSGIVKWITNLHATEGKPMAKLLVLDLCRMIELLKGFQLTFHRHIIPLAYCILLVSQHITFQALSVITTTKKGLTQDKSYNDQHLDVISSLNVAEKALNGPNTNERILVARLALSAAGLHHSTSAEEALVQLRGHLTRLELVCNVKKLLHCLCDCSFLYWHQVIVPVYFSSIFETRSDVTRILLMFNALTDCETAALIDTNKVSTQMNQILEDNLIQPLCQEIETNLRLQTHSHLQMTTISPFQQSVFEDQILHSNYPIRFIDEYICIKSDVEHYLSTMFYNLTTVVLHDWQTYGEMRQLAKFKHNLNTIEDHLPMQTLEQGLDVLEIMRNIHVFVSKYLYNMNNQIFVEEQSNNKHLNTINISHIANSIRTHGTGIMNTTVNFTYQFLQKKFFIFSQFMYDEHIKSRILKDLRFFCDNKTEIDQMYPYERAEKFNQGIRKLGITNEGLSYLDLFRRLISHIGNAMGYVRLIRSGGRRCLSDATCFLPTIDNVNELNELLNTENLSELSKKSANCLKRDIKNLTDNFAEATEYFMLLINVFVPVFQNYQNIHLRNFYMIVPPLTINFIEHMLTCKDRINKKNKKGAAFTDDGFAMGLAFIIRLLEQWSQFNSLHWFQSVRAKHAKEFQNLELQKTKHATNKEDAKLQQTLALTEKRLYLIRQEFELLHCSLNSARIFFQ